MSLNMDIYRWAGTPKTIPISNMLFEALSIRQASSKTFHSTNILTVNIAFLFRWVAYGDAKRVKFFDWPR